LTAPNKSTSTPIEKWPRDVKATKARLAAGLLALTVICMAVARYI
jgi:hypothetical protein